MTSSIFVIGLNHDTAPVEIREQVALTGDGLRLALKALRTADLPMFSEAAILSTCNRFEIYLAAANKDDAEHGFTAFMQHFYGIEPGALDEYLYSMSADSVVTHLMRVAAGLESMVLGEPQILGQVAQAYSKARSGNVSGTLLNRLFEVAVHTGKRARSETRISQHTTSVSHAAALLARDLLGDLKQMKALIIGAGEMATQAALALKKHDIGSLTCVSRNISSAEKLAEQIDGQAANWLQLPELLASTDVAISATGAPHVVLRAVNVMHVLPERDEHPLVMIDIAVPRDIEETIGDLPGVDLYDIDDLQNVVDVNLAKRQAAIPLVEAIITQEFAAFQTWLHSREVVPTLVDLRRRTEQIADVELQKTLRAINGASPETHEAVALLTHRIVQKILHEPTAFLKTNAQKRESVAVTQMVRDLFALDAGCEERSDG